MVKTQQIKRKSLKKMKAAQARATAADNEAEGAIPDYTTNGNWQTQDSDEYNSDESLDSDQELQLAFARNQLTPGLNVQMPAPKVFANDEAGLKRKLKDLYLNMEWVERMDITVPLKRIQVNDLIENEEDSEKANKTTALIANDDFKRESMFLRQAELAVEQALPTLNKLKISTFRPTDYFAQMAKSDEHMKKVREQLLSKHAETEKRDKIRKLRELKKMGKEVQKEQEKKKLEAKRRLGESIKKHKKGDKDDLQIELEENTIRRSSLIKQKAAKRAANATDKDGKKKNRVNLSPGNDENDERHQSRIPLKKDVKKFGSANDENRFENFQKKGEKDADGNKVGSKRGAKNKNDYKDSKFGFGGRKKRSKYNTSESYLEGIGGKKEKFNERRGGKAGAKGGPAAGGGSNKFKTPKEKMAIKKFTNKNKPKGRGRK